MDKKMFRLNEDGVTEWIVAENIDQVISFYQEITGGIMTETFKEEKKYDSALTGEDFIAGYIKEESPEKKNTMHYEDGRKVTKTVQEFLDEIDEVPSYFACSEY